MHSIKIFFLYYNLFHIYYYLINTLKNVWKKWKKNFFLEIKKFYSSLVFCIWNMFIKIDQIYEQNCININKTC